MKHVKKENGYVLVVIIGILTILSLMTITFATLSRIETRATRNYTDSVKCEKIAMAGLEHAIYEIRLDKFGTDTLAYNDDDNGNYGLDENFDASGTSWPGNTIFPGSDYDNDGVNGKDSAWIYLPGTSTATSAIRLPGNLLARYAILITDDREARVNINVTGNKAGIGNVHTSNEGWSSFEINLSNIIELAATGKGIATAIDIIDTRHGNDNAPGTSNTNDDPGKIPTPGVDGIDNDGDWVIGNDTNYNGIPDSGETDVDEADEATNEPNEFNSIFPYGDDVPFGLLSEAEIMGTSSYTSRLEEIFGTNTVSQAEQDSLKGWLTTCSADTIVCPSYTLGTSTATTMLNINALVNNEGAYTEGYDDSDKKVEMIRDVLEAGGITGAVGSDGYKERHQLAVNIKDFIDADDTVTKYPESSPVYYGVEKTPYINEVEAEVDATATDIDGFPTGRGKFIELFNPYDTAINIANWTITGTTMPDVTLTGPTIPAQGYYVIADDQNAYTRDDQSVDPKGFSYEEGADANQYEPNINNLSPPEEIILKDSSNNIIQKTTYGQAALDKTTRQLNDPRPTPLSASSSDPWLWTTASETAGEESDPFDPTVGSDGWDTITPTPTWPNSFLANRRFSNKGYLGFIHTGSQWTSFKVDSNIAYPNVLQYITVTDPSMDGIDNDGDGDIDTYDTDGDGDIDVNDTGDTGFQTGDFDGPEYRIPGLINVNTASTQVLQSLPNVDSTIAAAIQGSINKPFTSIGDLVDDVTQITGSGTKWSKESTFRSISNLITTRSNVFTVYITAQITDEAETSVFAEKKILAIVDRSVEPIKVRYFRWVTE